MCAFLTALLMITNSGRMPCSFRLVTLGMPLRFDVCDVDAVQVCTKYIY
jgi:hypothetical protein